MNLPLRDIFQAMITAWAINSFKSIPMQARQKWLAETKKFCPAKLSRVDLAAGRRYTRVYGTTGIFIRRHATLILELPISSG
jgi:hypothetical protein